MKRLYLLSVFLISLFSITATAEELRLPALVGDNMVLQQDCKVPLWGWAPAGEEVTVQGSWMESSVSAKADPDGRWNVQVKTPEAGGPFTLEIHCGIASRTLHNVMVGEVWVCSGQSNMQWSMLRFKDSKEDIPHINDPNLRLFDVPRRCSTEPQEDCDTSWELCTPETVKKFSATAYYYGAELRKRLKVPVGLIHSSYGGSTIEAWMNWDMLQIDPDFLPMIDRARTQFAYQEDPEQAVKQYEKQLATLKMELDEKDTLKSQILKNSLDLTSPGWDKIQLPLPDVAAQPGFRKGLFWFVYPFEIPESWQGKTALLELGYLDDLDSIYVNGILITEEYKKAKRGSQSTTHIPPQVLGPGTNWLAIRVLRTNLPKNVSGFEPQLKLEEGKDTDTLSLIGNWYRQKFPFQDSRAQETNSPEGNWNRKLERLQGLLLVVPVKPSKIDKKTATVLYNGMLTPIIPYKMRGVIWYQGESNVIRAWQYRKLFPLLIEEWRDLWDQGQFPFYYVQIAPFKYRGYDEKAAAELREAQTMALKVPGTAMAVTMDIGNPTDIHPQHKDVVGKRLALLAMARTYGQKGLIDSGPLYRKMKVEGDRIRLYFDSVGSGLVAKDGPLIDFQIAGPDRQFVSANAVIDGDTILVSSPRVNKPVAVRYGWSDDSQPNLFNSEGLPASSFRTDDWPGATFDTR